MASSALAPREPILLIEVLLDLSTSACAGNETVKWLPEAAQLFTHENLYYYFII